MTEIERLLAMEAIRKVKAAYFRCMDTKAWGELHDVFTEDAIFDVRGALEMPKTEAEYAAEKIITGRADIIAYVSKGLNPLISVHHGHMPEIDILSATEAKAIWPMSDMLILPEGSPFRIFRGWGYYTETYTRDDRWRIATLKLRRLFVRTET